MRLTGFPVSRRHSCPDRAPETRPSGIHDLHFLRSYPVDADLLKQLLPKTGPAVKAGGGQFLARSDKITPLVGDPPKRFVIIAFDSVAQAKDWHRSPAQQEVNAMVEKAERVRSFIVDSAM